MISSKELSFLNLCEYLLSSFERALASSVEASGAVAPIKSAMTHMLFPKGKRIRPLLSLLICNDLGGDPDIILPGAVSLELIHNASLIHDDLPALDNDDIRRGRATCHKQFGEATAILAGDYMVALAMAQALEVKLPESEAVMVAKELSSAFRKLCDGQQLDLLPDEKRGDLLSIHSLKTGALFEYAAALGSFGAGLDLETVQVCREFGLSFGVCFQMLDDFLDIFGSEEERGRPSSSDTRNKKTTFGNGSIADFSEQFRFAREDVDRTLDRVAKRLNQPRRPELQNVRTLIDRTFARYQWPQS